RCAACSLAPDTPVGRGVAAGGVLVTGAAGLDGDAAGGVRVVIGLVLAEDGRAVPGGGVASGDVVVLEGFAATGAGRVAAGADRVVKPRRSKPFMAITSSERRARPLLPPPTPPRRRER